MPYFYTRAEPLIGILLWVKCNTVRGEPCRLISFVATAFWNCLETFGFDFGVKDKYYFCVSLWMKNLTWQVSLDCKRSGLGENPRDYHLSRDFS